MKKVVVDMLRHFLNTNNLVLNGISVEEMEDINGDLVTLQLNRALNNTKVRNRFYKLMEKAAKYNYVIVLA